jgi:ABC-type bacteriocin/lantibiotic exporter with double-glycine peptidase domain
MFLTDVPLIQQEKPMACWHASVRMLFGYRQQCADPMDSQYMADTGITAAQFVDLAAAAGLQTIPRVNQSYDWTFIDNLLSTYGPIWAAGDWNGAPHIIVLIGVDAGGKLIVNDPAFPAPQQRDMGWFNQHIDSTVDIPMMYLP